MKKLLVIFVLTLLSAGCENGPETAHYSAIVEGTVVRVPALSGGELVARPVSEGQLVSRGELLVQIDTTEMSLQGEQIAASLSELSAQETLATSEVKRAKVQRDYLAQRAARIRQLFSEKSASRQQLDDIENQLQQAEIGYHKANQNLATIAAKGRQLKAQRALLAKKIRDACIAAPLSGRIAELFYEVGEAVAPMTPVAELVGLEKVDARIYLPESRLGAIAYDQQVSVKIDGREESLSGRISWISPKAEFTPKAVLTDDTRSSLVYAVNVEINNPEEILKHGMPVEILLERPEAE
ncbi:MAG TPA: HlyD family efflux transporter periplasmic adaptor subunit [Calditrichia bacterium]|nr:HlyD family efflux transporter periplasmic adaptor subunit [Calditrichia bacterium]